MRHEVIGIQSKKDMDQSRQLPESPFVQLPPAVHRCNCVSCTYAWPHLNQVQLVSENNNRTQSNEHHTYFNFLALSHRVLG